MIDIEEAVGRIRNHDDVMGLVRRAIEAERKQCAKISAGAVMSFKAHIGSRYYPGYHEDMRDFVRSSVLKRNEMAKDRVEMLDCVLHEIMEQTYRAGFADGENHASENDAYTRGQEADYMSHVQRLRSERGWAD
jgi:hypothetical protein